MNTRESIVIANSDAERLRALIDGAAPVRRLDQEHLRTLSDQLAQAEVVDGNQVPASVIAMNSYVDFTDLGTGRTHKYQLVFPKDADLARSRVSILAPIGTALLGRRVGTEVECPILRGVRRFRIEQVRQKVPTAEQSAAAGSRRSAWGDLLLILRGALRRTYWHLTSRKHFHLGWSSQ